MAALRAAVFPLFAKNRRGGHFLPPPPSSARVNSECLKLNHIGKVRMKVATKRK